VRQEGAKEEHFGHKMDTKISLLVHLTVEHQVIAVHFSHKRGTKWTQRGQIWSRIGLHGEV
jgi:hypothetical protein